MQDYLKNLNAAQYEAAVSIDGPLLILAGAGSGKTHTLVSRVMYMLDSGINPEQILLLTFTNKAANEMKERIIKKIGPAGEDITARTFHSFCADVLRHNASKLGLSPDYVILDSSDMKSAISIAMEEFMNRAKKDGISYNLRDFPNKNAIASVYEYASNNFISFKESAESFENTVYYKNEVVDILNLFKEYKRSRNLLDYEDLLHCLEKLLREIEKFRYLLSEAFKYILVDEYQDTNILQDKILDYLTCAHNNVAVVGDDNQSIYKFRGACIKNIITFEERHSGCKTVILDTNYRSSQEILDFSNTMMSFASEGIKKNLKGTFRGDKPELIVTRNSDAEAQFILNKIKSSSVPLKDIAVISRNSKQPLILESMLNSAGIPYNKFGGTKFLEKNVIKDLLAFIRLVVNPKDELASFRVLLLYPGIGKTYAGRISEIIAKDGIDAAIEKYKKRSFGQYLTELKENLEKISKTDVNAALDFLINKYYFDVKERSVTMSDMAFTAKAESLSSLKDDKEDAKMLAAMAEKYKSPAKFIGDIILEATTTKSDENKLNITTIHSAKGLEYDTVFILDCIDGIMPRGNEYEDYNEELRCMYVACTRAKRKLYIMVPEYYAPARLYGKFSPFIDRRSILNTLKPNVPEYKINSLRHPTDFRDVTDSLLDCI